MNFADVLFAVNNTVLKSKTTQFSILKWRSLYSWAAMDVKHKCLPLVSIFPFAANSHMIDKLHE